MDEFLASISMDKWESLPTATTVLSSFNKMCCGLSTEELKIPPVAYRWDRGSFDSSHERTLTLTLFLRIFQLPRGTSDKSVMLMLYFDVYDCIINLCDNDNAKI